MATYTLDLFMTLDGFGSGPVGYWGKGGPGLEERQARVFFGGEQETLVLGAGTYRLMAVFAAERDHDSAFDALTARDKIVISRTLKEPLDWANTTLIAEDAVDAVKRLRVESSLPLRSHGSISMNKALLVPRVVS